MKIKMTVAYDGTSYIGWQKQPSFQGLSVQEVVSRALGRVLKERDLVIHASGRTDAGVHALGQVIHFCTEKAIPPERLAMAANHFLPPDIRLRDALRVRDDFHAQKSAIAKTYRYTISRGKGAKDQLFACRFAWPIFHELDIPAMREAAAYLVGRHNFRSFTSTGHPVKSFEREIFSLTIAEPQSQAALPWQEILNPLTIEVRGNGFLYKMVRNIAARLVQAGCGSLLPAEMEDLLAGKPFRALPPAPPQGLMLLSVEYPPDILLYP